MAALNRLIAAGGGFPVRRGERDVEAINAAVDLVRDGHVVAMSPHGTRQRKGLVKRYQNKAHTGAGWELALEAGVPFVPGGDRRRGPALEARPLACPLREADPARRSEGEDPSLAAPEATDRLMAEIERLGVDLR